VHAPNSQTQREAKLRRSQEQLAEAQSLAHIGSFDWDLLTDEVVWSAEQYRVFGVAPADASLHSDFVLDRVHPEDRPELDAVIAGMMISGKPAEREVRIIRPDGEIRVCHARAAVQVDAAGRPVRMIGTFQDVTERRREEGERQQQAEIWRLILESMSEAVIVADSSQRLILFNSSAERLVGIGLTDAPPETWSERYGAYREDGVTPFPPEENPLLRALRGEFVDFAGLFIRNDRVPRGRWLNGSVRPVRCEGGAVRAAVAVVRDVTEQKRAEAQYRTLVEQIPAVTYVTDVGDPMRLAYVSPQIGPLLGYDVDAWLTPGFWTTRVHDEDRAAMLAELEASVATGRTFSAEYRILARDGRVVWVRDQAVPIGSGPTGFLQGVAFDVSERRLAELEIARSREELRALAARLQQIREEEKRRIAREVHDELGQVLTALKFEVARAAAREERPEIDPLTPLIERALTSVRRICSEIRPSLLDDLGLTAAAEWQLQEFRDRTGLQCVLSAALNDERIDAERSTALFRILQEALTNVARHARASRVQVRLREEPGAVTLEVQDDGAGIEPGRATDSRSLGLLGMRERALIFGGSILVSAGAGKGTIVRVSLPLGP
jgi:two-component system sensor histidine kinase UhpB